MNGVNPFEPFDISPDVYELGRTPIALVTSGTFDDVPKTLEVLETQGVNVCAFGMDKFPGLVKKESEFKANLTTDNALTLSQYLFTQFSI